MKKWQVSGTVLPFLITLRSNNRFKHDQYNMRAKKLSMEKFSGSEIEKVLDRDP